MSKERELLKRLVRVWEDTTDDGDDLILAIDPIVAQAKLLIEEGEKGK